ncbi:type II toxin-antitoxin system PemK/MazF family toxin [Peribacillus frigoritolerans]|uniref:type II toxin-antitoxin system PemK/MazF family toxin n=1 Tax=Peribacillus castrilensis TaxID=2897690 RepID=UPI002DCE9A91|nr:type II toxin-antitoxin system PemK/MazF family toxin [Peribacillus castrilensis]
MSDSKIKTALEKTKIELVDWYSTTTDEKEKAYAIQHAEWTQEKAVKNKFIRRFKGTNKGDEVQRKRRFVFWTELGMNVGSELCESHFCVVIKEFEKTAVVVPISSKKDGDSKWKTEDKGYFEIGSIGDLPKEKRESYAVVSQIRTISKKRLSSYQDPKTKKYLRIKLNDVQMDIIDEAIKKTLAK